MARNKRAEGGIYEKKVAEYLKRRGCEILETNYTCRGGEIDLIARDGDYLVFVEVKYRGSDAAGSALEAVTPIKAARVRRAAAVYLMKNGLPDDISCRFDAAGVDGDRLTYLENAF